jgi:antirestriction protein ArdC
LLRYYRVFNLNQTKGIADKLGLTDTERIPRIDECERIVAAMPNPPKREQSDRAWYRPSTDSVGMPAKDSFNSAERYYATLFHELTHSTGHASRVGREGIEKLERFGSESYSKGELIAELGSAMLCGTAMARQNKPLRFLVACYTRTRLIAIPALLRYRQTNWRSTRLPRSSLCLPQMPRRMARIIK